MNAASCVRLLVMVFSCCSTSFCCVASSLYRSTSILTPTRLRCSTSMAAASSSSCSLSICSFASMGSDSLSLCRPHSRLSASLGWHTAAEIAALWLLLAADGPLTVNVDDLRDSVKRADDERCSAGACARFTAGGDMGVVGRPLAGPDELVRCKRSLGSSLLRFEMVALVERRLSVILPLVRCGDASTPPLPSCCCSLASCRLASCMRSMSLSSSAICFTTTSCCLASPW
mmetsp:Transcript_51465/g.126341  ORF Transcript_51465/g.126341 Transcript_51465/m.126341 type:complete len:230 (-) Transcript_51465:413-1102(-)